MKSTLIRFIAVIWTSISLSIPSVLPATAATTYDFGDAPDGKKTYYKTGASIGSFPSLLASDGARTRITDKVWLGPKVDEEADSNQVDADLYDDGAYLKLNSCADSKAMFLVHVSDPGNMTGTAYLNLFVDWDKDGDWGDADECAPEWAVRNFPVDLSAQGLPVKAYIPAFTAGKKVTDLWWRATVTKNERVTSETGVGEFRIGEVEDYGPATAAKPPDDDEGDGTGKRYGAICDPDPLVIPHGGSGTVKIKKKPKSEPIVDIEFPNSVTPETKGRKITLGANSFVYKSKKKDPPLRVVTETVLIRVNFEDASIVIKCQVSVVHKDQFTPVPQDLHDYTLTGLTSYYQTEPFGEGQSYLNATLETIPTEIVAMNLTGVAMPFDVQFPPIGPGDLQSAQFYLNNNSGNWPCTLMDSLLTCEGADPLTDFSLLSLFFNVDVSANRTGALHLHALSNGEVVGAIDISLQR